MKKTFRVLLSLALCFALLSVSALAIPSSSMGIPTDTPQMQYIKAEELSYWLRNYHLDSGINDDPLRRTYEALSKTQQDLSDSELRNALIDYFGKSPDNYVRFARAMFASYDSHTYFMTKDEYAASFPTNDSYQGLGIAVNGYGPFLRILEVYEGSAADKAGLAAGDLICGINGTDIRGMDYADSAPLLVSADGSAVRLDVLHGDGTSETVSVKPADVGIPNLSLRLLSDGGAELTIRRFSGDDFLDLLAKIRGQLEENDVHSLLIDLRGNPGGDLTYLLAALNLMIPDRGVRLFTDHDRYQNEDYFTDGTGLSLDPIVILVNGSTASSAELFSGALRDAGYAVLVGEQTFGKSRGQVHLDFYDDSTAIISVSEMYLPEAGSVESVGLTPDYEVENEPVSPELPDLSPLPTDRNLGSSADKTAVLALEQRLSLLGYGLSGADEVFDGGTLDALHAFQAGQGFAKTDYCTADELDRLDRLTKSYLGAQTEQDTQYDEALSILDAALSKAA